MKRKYRGVKRQSGRAEREIRENSRWEATLGGIEGER